MVGFERRTDDCACDDVPVSLNENSLAVLRDTEFAFRCRFTFFILTVVILMNLLIAMMADTFSKIAANAKAECTHSHHSTSCPGHECHRNTALCRPNAAREDHQRVL